MGASYESIDTWLERAEASGATTVLAAELASVFDLGKRTIASLARRGEFGPVARDAGRFLRVELSGVRAFLDRYRCAFLGWVSAKEACRLSGAKESTLIFWLNAGVIRGGRDMHGRVRIDPASLSAVREDLRWTSLPDELDLQGTRHYSLAHLARSLTVRSGVTLEDPSFEREFRRNYTMFYRWMTQTDLSRQVKRLGRRRALYIPAGLYDDLVDTIRPQDAARLAGETPFMLHYWARKGRIGFVQFNGTQKMISRGELNDFLAYRRTQTHQPRRGPVPSSPQPHLSALAIDGDSAAAGSTVTKDAAHW